MPSKLNSEFNYRFQVMGETVWEKIKTLKGFLEGRIRASALEEVGNLKYQAKIEELRMLEKTNGPLHQRLNLKAEIIELDSVQESVKEAYQLNQDEIKIIQKVLAELYEIAEPTRISGYTDEQMFEANAANEFTVMIGKELQAEIIANGRPSPAKIRNAMSNPYTWNALKEAGLIPEEAILIQGNVDPFLQIEIKECKQSVQINVLRSLLSRRAVG